jgi:hypothetical protein
MTCTQGGGWAAAGTKAPTLFTKFGMIQFQRTVARMYIVTHGQICVDYRPQKEEPNRTRLTVGGNLIEYPGDVSTPTADTTTAKMVVESTILTPNAEFMCADIKDFYIQTPMARYKYMRLPIALVPLEIVEGYIT